MKDTPYDYCFMCAETVEEDEVIRYGDFNLCSEECKERLINEIHYAQDRAGCRSEERQQ